MFLKKLICFFALTAFLATSVMPPSYAQSVMELPQAGTIVNLSQSFMPVVLRGMKVDPQDPFKFEFLVDPGETGLQNEQLKAESTKLIRYFLAAVTTPDKDLWVNLSPYEQDRIIPEDFGMTEMGRDLLSQDYILKQITSSLMYPEKDPGKAFWQEVYQQAYDMYGTTDIPVDTFNKVWITPDTAEVYEDNGVAFVGESHLKVMLESDYLAANKIDPGVPVAQEGAEIREMTKEIIRRVMLPVIEKEVNEGRNFAQLRQVYQSLILSAWYKKRLKDSILSRAYADQNKVLGVDIEDKDEAAKIWARYVDSFKKGAYNYIKEEYDQHTQELIPRKYFSGGFDGAQVNRVVSFKAKGSIVNWSKWKSLMLAGLFIATFSLATSNAVQAQMSPVIAQTTPERVSAVKQEAFVKVFESLPVDRSRAEGWDGLRVDREELERAQGSGLSGDTISVRNSDGYIVARLFIKVRTDQQAAFLILSPDSKFKWVPMNREWSPVYAASLVTPNIDSRDDLKNILKDACLTQKKWDNLPAPVRSSQFFRLSGAAAEVQDAGSLSLVQGGVEYTGPTQARDILFEGASQSVRLETPRLTHVVLGGDISGSLKGKEEFVRTYLAVFKRFLTGIPADCKVSLLNMAVGHDIKVDEPDLAPLIENGTLSDVQEGLNAMAKDAIGGATDLYGALKKAVDLVPSDGKGVVVFGTDAFPDIFAKKIGDPREMLDIFRKKAEKEGLFEAMVKKGVAVVFFNNGQINPLFKEYIDAQKAQFGPALKVTFHEDLENLDVADLLGSERSVSFQLEPSVQGTFSVTGIQGNVLASVDLPVGGGEKSRLDLVPTEFEPLFISPDGKIDLKDIEDGWASINAVFYPKPRSVPVSRLFNDAGLQILADGSSSMTASGFWSVLEDVNVPVTFFGIRPEGRGLETVAHVPTGVSVKEFLKKYTAGSTNGVAGMNALLSPGVAQKGGHILMVSDLEFNTGTMQLDMSVEDMRRDNIVVSVATTDVTYRRAMTWLSRSSPVSWEALDFNASGVVPISVRGVLTALLTGGNVYHGPTLKDALLQAKQERAFGKMGTPSVLEQMDGGAAQVEFVRKDGTKETRIYRLKTVVPLLPAPRNEVAVEVAQTTDYAEKGGIDFDTGKLDLDIKGDGSAVVRTVDPALFDQLQAAPGLVPVMIGIRPAHDLPAFLGLS